MEKLVKAISDELDAGSISGRTAAINLVDLLREMPDHCDGPAAMAVATLIEDISRRISDVKFAPPKGRSW